jgi:hypothetical protein
LLVSIALRSDLNRIEGCCFAFGASEDFPSHSRHPWEKQFIRELTQPNTNAIASFKMRFISPCNLNIIARLVQVDYLT